MCSLLILWMLAAVGGCGTARPGSEGLPGAVFPHGEDYERPAAHGLDAVAEGATCTQCHPVEPTADTASPPVPACKDCHSLYPHPADYAEGAVHGEAWGSACYGCHGERGDHVPAGQTDAVCTSCHDYPHGAGWLRADHHGVALMAAGDFQTGCASCHDDPSPCTDCHVNYPHPAGFVDDHAAVYAQTQECFGQCHDGATELPGDLTCEDCHAEEDRR